MANEQVDVAVVGAGIVGLAHAYTAAKAGRKVAVFERNPVATGASIRNFGMIWPIGQAAGELHQLSLRSREIWLDFLEKARLPYRNTGSLHVTYRVDEAAVAQEFADKSKDLGYSAAWLSPLQTLDKTHAVREQGLLGALWSSTELTVDPRQIVRMLPAFLAEKYGVRFFFNTAVHGIERRRVQTGGKQWQAETVIVAAGDDFQTLYPEAFRQTGLTRSKLQMLRTAPQPDGWELGPSLAFGLSFKHYPTFQVCESLGALKRRIATEMPEFERYGIHVMASQTVLGEITLGDSHEYGLAVNIFDNWAIDELILHYAQQYIRLPEFAIAERWHGVYAKHPDLPYLCLTPEPGVKVITVTSGIGMTLSFGIAEKTFCNC
ncbi:MAG TPA: TIGR03364 family FAD-dependent oxidoreductase [Bryobacteraceae bacterium]|nr:TIGR03364 family FAD-dependent oxidoreductase [Bryobacteraceae bacterium]